MTNALVATDHEANRNHYPTLEETDLNDPIAHCELIDAAHKYARATLAADEAVEAARTSATTLVRSDIEALEAINAEWEAKTAHNQKPKNEAGFTAEVRPRTKGDLNALNQAAEMASLRYQQCRAASLRAELNAEQATHAVDTAQVHLVESARRLTIRKTVTA